MGMASERLRFGCEHVHFGHEDGNVYTVATHHDHTVALGSGNENSRETLHAVWQAAAVFVRQKYGGGDLQKT